MERLNLHSRNWVIFFHPLNQFSCTNQIKPSCQFPQKLSCSFVQYKVYIQSLRAYLHVFKIILSLCISCSFFCCTAANHVNVSRRLREITSHHQGLSSYKIGLSKSEYQYIPGTA